MHVFLIFVQEDLASLRNLYPKNGIFVISQIKTLSLLNIAEYCQNKATEFINVYDLVCGS